MSYLIKVIQIITKYDDEISLHVRLLTGHQVETVSFEALRKDTARFYQLAPMAIADLSYEAGQIDQKNREQRTRSELAQCRQSREKSRKRALLRRQSKRAATITE